MQANDLFRLSLGVSLLDSLFYASSYWHALRLKQTVYRLTILDMGDLF